MSERASTSSRVEDPLGAMQRGQAQDLQLLRDVVGLRRLEALDEAEVEQLDDVGLAAPHNITFSGLTSRWTSAT